MGESAQQSHEELGRGSVSRQRRVNEAIGEARAALQETLGIQTPTPRQQLARRWALRASSLHAKIHGLRNRPRPKIFNLLFSSMRSFLPTLGVLAVLLITIAGGGFGICSAYVSAEAAGGFGVIIPGDPSPSADEAFTFAAVPMSVVKRGPAGFVPTAGRRDAGAA
jgi:hypothetical protein